MYIPGTGIAIFEIYTGVDPQVLKGGQIRDVTFREPMHLYSSITQKLKVLMHFMLKYQF